MSRIVATLMLLTSASFSHAEDWTFMVEPYLLASSIEGDVSVGRVSGVPVDVDFEKILETLSIGAMVHAEAHHTNGWGIIVDYGFMDLEDDISTPRGGVISGEVHQGVLEALISRRIAIASGSLELLFGIRWWDNEVEVTFDPLLLPGSRSVDLDEDWTDAVVGVRYVTAITDALDIALRADVGGAGISSDLTWNLSATGIYAFNDTAAVEFGYKALYVDYETGSGGSPGYFAYDTLTHGPVVGLQLTF